MVRLNDEDHRVHAASQLGGVQRQLREIRGTMVESFILAGVDVTQSITRLENAGLLKRGQFRWSLPDIDKFK